MKDNGELLYQLSLIFVKYESKRDAFVSHWVITVYREALHLRHLIGGSSKFKLVI